MQGPGLFVPHLYCPNLQLHGGDPLKVLQDKLWTATFPRKVRRPEACIRRLQGCDRFDKECVNMLTTIPALLLYFPHSSLRFYVVFLSSFGSRNIQYMYLTVLLTQIVCWYPNQDLSSIHLTYYYEKNVNSSAQLQYTGYNVTGPRIVISFISIIVILSKRGKSSSVNLYKVKVKQNSK